MRILCHAQHLSGVGHFVRMHAIACGLATAHDVHLVDGGRRVPRREPGSQPSFVRLPRLVRLGGRLVSADGDTSGEALLATRAHALAQAARRIRPDVVLVDHFPFSKWELAGEITAAVAAARRANPRVRVVCSLRDIVRQTRCEDVPPAAYEARVLSLLHDTFDAILVHGDRAFTRLEEHFGRMADLPVPVAYTGFVTGEPAPPPPDGDYAVLSCGGGARGLVFLLAAIEGFRRASAAGVLGVTKLVVFPGAFPARADVDALEAATRYPEVELRTFSPDFATVLAGSRLSISRAGYNTTVELLRARVRAVVVPDTAMADQGPRATRLGELGLAMVVDGDPPGADAIAGAIADALGRPRPHHRFDLDGVARVRALLERLVEGGDVEWSSTPMCASRSTSV